MTGGLLPPEKVFGAPKCRVLTFHGAEAVDLSLSDFIGPLFRDLSFPIFRKKVNAMLGLPSVRRNWSAFHAAYSGVITVSRYGQEEFARCFPQMEASLTHIYHGVDRKVFYPPQKKPDPPGYFLHISDYQNVKNTDRLLEAYKLLRRSFIGAPPDFMIVGSGYPARFSGEGITLINKSVEQRRVADLMRGAISFLYPSLHETFGLPILEAMACGVPVVTSNSSACVEVAGNAAILVDERSTESILCAMKELLLNPSMRLDYSHRSLVRASNFSWDKSAVQHLRFFEYLLSSQGG